MFAKIINSQEQLVTIVDWRIVEENGRYLDRFIDSEHNVYLERPHNDVIDGAELINLLTTGAYKFHQLQGAQIHLGRTSA